MTALSPVRVIADVMVPMRDGVRLATDIYLPPDSETKAYPVLLERTPYDKLGTNLGDFSLADREPMSKPEIASRFVASGYAYVLQDCRGRYGSEGSFEKYLSEAEDGVDTLAWLSEQPWCNGRIGTLGLSYGAHVQSAMACLNPPFLGAMFLDSGGFSSAYHSGVRQGGAFELKQLTWARKHALLAPETLADSERRRRLEAEDIRQWVGRRWGPGSSPLAAAQEYESFILDQWGHDRFDDFWKRLGIYARGWYDRYADVPMVHMASWYDPYAQTAIENYTGLAPIKRGPVKLILGPWTHGRRSLSYSGDVDFGPHAPLDGNLAPDYITLRRDWFDRHLRGLPAPDHLAEPVHIFIMGGGSGRRNVAGRLDHGGRWRAEASWPIARARPTRLYLEAGGGLVPSTPDSGICCFDADPSNPVPTIGGAIASGAPVMVAGAFDQRETDSVFGARQPGRALADREDVLIFETPPLEQAMEVTGNAVAMLYVSSSAIDTDITVKLVDVYPPSADYPQGFAMNLAHGILRMRFRNSFEQPEPIVPGAVNAVSIPLFPTSNLFAAGHRLRVEIAGSNFPHFDVNPNSDWRVPGAPPQVAHNRVHLGGPYPSSIVLPVVPAE